MVQPDAPPGDVGAPISKPGFSSRLPLGVVTSETEASSKPKKPGSLRNSNVIVEEEFVATNDALYCV